MHPTVTYLNGENLSINFVKWAASIKTHPNEFL